MSNEQRETEVNPESVTLGRDWKLETGNKKPEMSVGNKKQKSISETRSSSKLNTRPNWKLETDY